LYIALQQAYQKKATGDIAAVSEAVRLLVEEHGCEPLTEEFITSVCKNARSVRAPIWRSQLATRGSYRAFRHSPPISCTRCARGSAPSIGT
jgi:hypothetical protein